MSRLTSISLFVVMMLQAVASSSSSSPPYTPADIAAARSRASTPVRPDRPVPASEIDPSVVDLAAMWVNASAQDSKTNSTSCSAYLMEYELSLRLMPERGALRDVFDSLQLEQNCGITPPAPTSPSSSFFVPYNQSQLEGSCTISPFFVDGKNGNDANPGTLEQPFQHVPRALEATRSARVALRSSSSSSSSVACIVLRAGIHFLGAASTQVLTSADSGLIVTSYYADTAPAWISGGIDLSPLTWVSSNITSPMNVYEATVATASWIPGLQTYDTTDPSVVPTRLFQAYFPNTYNIEYFSGDLPGNEQVTEWSKPPIMPLPQFLYKDLAASGEKNWSTMDAYNAYSSASGSLCNHWEQPPGMGAYVCSNGTAGGWEEIERGFAISGQLGFPIGVLLNNSQLPASVTTWTSGADPNGTTPWQVSNVPILTQWHNQGWFQASYAITDIAQGGAAGGGTYLNMSADGVFPAGGWQGGRTMENCKPDNLDPSQPLCSGPWYVRNVRQELDSPNEYFFDTTTQVLYLFYNASSGTPPPPTYGLIASQLEVFFNLSGTMDEPVTDITFAGIGFRDQRHGQLERWADPSGGDWALRRAGLFHLEGTERVTISGNTFYRTDANSIMVTGYNRNATIIDNEFAFVGMTCVATYGNTLEDDGTTGEQPWGTIIAYNKAHEIGQYQLQSSLWFTSRSTLTRAEGDVIFNLPRASINLNDAFGGGNNLTKLAIWNTCRHSSDHGPINSWDRMPFLTDIASGGLAPPSYAPLHTETSFSLIIANYGASQGEDNDDGSSFYDTHDCFFYDASGFKMDYGGSDSLFHNNVVVALHGQNCLGTASFTADHATQIFENDCIVYGTERVDDLFENCDPNLAPNVPISGRNNRFYTQNANASATCDCCGLRPITGEWAKNIETNASSFFLPSPQTIIGWGRAKTGLGPIPTKSSSSSTATTSTSSTPPPPPTVTNPTLYSAPSLSCGPNLCFASGFGSGVVLAMQPEIAAIYGSAPLNSTGQIVTLTVLPAVSEAQISSPLSSSIITAPINPDGTWKAFLPAMPAGGNFTITATCPTCGSSAVMYDVTFGLVIFLSGQSNAWLPLWFTFERFDLTAAILNGSYSNVRIWRGGLGKISGPNAPSGNYIGPAGPEPGSDSSDALTNQWRHPIDVLPPITPEFRPGEPWLWEFPALGMYTAAYLTDLLVEASGAESVVPIGVLSVPVGGTMVEEWVNFDTQASTCSNITCMCKESGCDQQQPLNEENCTANSDLFRGNIEPFVNMTLHGWWYLQGENNVYADAGNSAFGTGYGCMFPTLVSSWRKLWSTTPSTTSPTAPFGFVMLADGTDEGNAVNMAQLRWSQTANYGFVPNPALPNTYMAAAHDAGDPWDADMCASNSCCVDAPEALGPNCLGDHRGQWSFNDTNWFMGCVHPRTKGLVSHRLAQGAYAAYFGAGQQPQQLPPTTGPTLAGCTLSGNGNTQRLQIRFNTTFLAGQNITWSPGATVEAEDTALYVLVNATLPANASANHHGPSNSYRGPFANGNEFGVEGWIPVNAYPGPGTASITIDLSSLPGGARPTAVRYAWGGSGQGAPFQARMCCGPTVDVSLEPCAPESCPLKQTGLGSLPGVPFIAAIDENGHCECLQPQTCDG